jgi:hypothetical protein
MGQLSQNNCPCGEEISELKSDLDSDSRSISEFMSNEYQVLSYRSFSSRCVCSATQAFTKPSV